MNGCIVSVENNASLDYVFGGEARASFAAEVDLLPGFVAAADLESRSRELGSVEVVLCTWSMEALSAEQIERYFPSLRAVFYVAGSVRYFARPFLERGVRVFSAWGAMALSVAEYAAAWIVLACQGAFNAACRYRGGDYDESRRAALYEMPGISGAKIGILGAGRIGSRVVELLRPYGAETLVYDPFVSDAALSASGARRAGLEEIFSECHVVSNHIADHPETRGILDYRLFGRMRENAAFVNTGRGAQVVEADLARALREKPDRCALLDDTWPEPCPAGSELRSLPNVVITPHISGMGRGTVLRMNRFMLGELRAFRTGAPLSSEVTLPMLATMA
jgi:phosphoglycerate dehydrogenase-like enzyme